MNSSVFAQQPIRQMGDGQPTTINDNEQQPTARLVVGGVTFLLDEEDMPRVAERSWRLFDNGRGHRYAQTSVYVCKRKGRSICRTVRLHRFLLGLEPGDGRIADHINRDTTDNRKANLRIADASLNSRNRSRKHGGPMRTKDGWVVKLRGDGAPGYLGFYRDYEAAKSVFDAVAGGSHV